MNSNNCNRGSGSSAQDLNLRKMIRAKRIVNRIKSIVQGLDDDSSRVSVNGGGGGEQCGFTSGGFNTKALIHNFSNFKQSGVPVRFMYYMNGTWVGFSKEVFELLKEGFLAQKLILEVSIDGSKFLFDFLRMLQVDMANGTFRSISWIDVNKNSFFPKRALDGEPNEVGSTSQVQQQQQQQQPKVVIEVRIDKRKRDDDSKSESSGSSSDSDSDSDEEQTDESSCSVVQGPPKKPHLIVIEEPVIERRNWSNVVVLKEGDQSYMDIKKIFLSGVKKIDQGINVTSIHRCLYTSPLANARLQSFRRQMESTKAARGGVANHKLAWHGTSSEGVATILSHGFGMTSKIAGSHPYGHGIYLSPARLPETSTLLSESDHNGEKHALLCRVIMGNAEKVTKGSNQFHPSSEQFDTGVDDLDNPKLYIVWNTHMNRHILPEYVVSYKTSENLQEVSSRRTPVPQNRTGVHMPFVQLFEMLKSSVPPSKYQELELAHKAFKEGRINKDTLIKLLRSIAGDAPIISAIHKFRSMKSTE